MGLVSFVVTVTVLGVALGALAAPAWYWALPDGIELGIAQVDSLAEAVALVPIGAVLLFLGIPALNGLGRLYGRFAQLLLGTSADPALTAQVTELRGSRARVIAAADAERRRLERDLHDGAQQRLVALALTLRMAEKRAAETGDDGTGDLVRRAGEEARLALEELRDLAPRHPPGDPHEQGPGRRARRPGLQGGGARVDPRQAGRAAARAGGGGRLFHRFGEPRERSQARARHGRLGAGRGGGWRAGRGGAR